MSEKTKSNSLIVALIWLTVFAGGALAWRYFFAPRAQGVVVQQSGSDARFQHQVTLALDSFSGYAVFRSPAFKEELAIQGIGLNLRDDQADYDNRLQALRKGEVQMAVFTIDALLAASARAGESPASIVMVIDETIGADAMIAFKQSVPNINGLNRGDTKIVATRSSPSETLARVVMAHFNLPDLNKQPWVDANGAQDVYDKFKAADPAKPNAFVLWEPFVSKALENPAAHVLIDSSKFRGYIVDVLVVQRKYLLANEEQVRKFVEAYLRASYAARQASGGMQALVAADAQAQQAPLTTTQAASLAQKVWWKNTQENYAHFGLGTTNTAGSSSAQSLQHLDEMIRNIVGVLVKTGGMTKDPTNNQPNEWYYDKIFRKLHDAKFHPGVLAGGADGEALRPQGSLAPLSDVEWESLVEVGALEVDSLVFARGTSRLTDQSKQTLDHLQRTLDTWPQYYLIVRGNSRREGDPAANRKLASDRANAAADYLLEAGVPKQRIRASATEAAVAGGEGQSVSFVLGQKPY